MLDVLMNFSTDLFDDEGATLFGLGKEVGQIEVRVSKGKCLLHELEDSAVKRPFQLDDV